MRDIPEDKRRLVDALRAGSIPEFKPLAAFMVDEVTAFAANLFGST